MPADRLDPGPFRSRPAAEGQITCALASGPGPACGWLDRSAATEGVLDGRSCAVHWERVGDLGRGVPGREVGVAGLRPLLSCLILGMSCGFITAGPADTESQRGSCGDCTITSCCSSPRLCLQPKTHLEAALQGHVEVKLVGLPRSQIWDLASNSWPA